MVTQTLQPDSRLARVGGWLFRRRTSLPLPLALALLLLPAATGPGVWRWFASGALIVAAGETLRFWAVRHIGAVSRTRSDRLGPLVSTGPFAHVRNPLYLGNIALWAGFAVSARLPWLVPVFLALLALEYHAIVRWEETLLESRRGDDYREYARRVPRWLPALRPPRALERSKPHNSPLASRESDVPERVITDAPVYSWRDTFFSERGTLIAIVVGYLLLSAKLLVWMSLSSQSSARL
jgi:protein-S-isoprenylcysteine O-methyltransferase Ste14